LDKIGSVINKQHYTTTSNPDDIFGSHAEGYVNKLLINLNEIEIKNTFNLESRIKSFITEDTLCTNYKNIRCSKVNNYSRVVFTSNKGNIIPIDITTGDRRFVLFKSSNKYATSTQKFTGEFWTDFRERINKDSFTGCLYNDLLTINTKIDWVSSRPLTEAYYAMAKINNPKELHFINNYVESLNINDHGFVNEDENDDKQHIVLFTGFYEAYKVYVYEYYNNHNIYNISKFHNELLHIGVPINKYKCNLRGEYRNKAVYEFNIKAMKDYLKTKNY
jgi:hypothetical protein